MNADMISHSKIIVLSLIFIALSWNSFGQELVINRHFSQNDFLNISSDEKLLLTSEGLWDLESGRLIKHVYPSCHNWNFVPDQKHIIAYRFDTIRQGYICLIDMNTWEEKKVFGEGVKRISHFIFSPNGRYVASFTEQNIIIWDLQTGQMLSKYKCTYGYKQKRQNINHFVNRSQFLYAGNEGIVLWDVKTGEPIQKIAIEGRVNSCVLSKDSSKVLIASSKGASLWDIETGANIYHFRKRRKNVQQAKYARFSPNEDKVYVCSPQNVLVFDLRKGKLVNTLTIEEPEYIAFSNDNSKILCLNNNSCYWYDLESGDKVYSLDFRYNETFFHNGNLYAIGYRFYNKVKMILNVDSQSFLNGVLRRYYYYNYGRNYGYSTTLLKGGQYFFTNNHIVDINTGEIVRCFLTMNSIFENQYPVKFISSLAYINRRAAFNPLYPKPLAFPVRKNMNPNGTLKTGINYHDFRSIDSTLHAIRYASHRGKTYFQFCDLDSLMVKSSFNIEVDRLKWCVFTSDSSILFANQTVRNSKLFYNLNSIDLKNNTWIIVDSLRNTYSQPIAVSKSGKYIVLNTGSIEIRELPSYRLIYKNDESNCVNGRFSHSEKYFVWLEYGQTKMFDIDKGEVIWVNGDYHWTYYNKTNNPKEEFINYSQRMKFSNFDFTIDEKYFISSDYHLFECSTGKLVAKYYLFNDGESMVIRANGQYNASTQAHKHFHYVDGLKVSVIKDYTTDTNYNPELFSDLFSYREAQPIQPSIDSCFKNKQFNKQYLSCPSTKITPSFLYNLSKYWDLKSLHFYEGINYDKGERIYYSDSLINLIYCSIAHPENIIKISFHSCSQEVIDSLVNCFPNIEEIHINCNEEEIENQMYNAKSYKNLVIAFDLAKLKELHIYNDCLEDIQIDISNLPSLKHVDIRAAKLKQKPTTIGFELESCNELYRQNNCYQYNCYPKK